MTITATPAATATATATRATAPAAAAAPASGRMPGALPLLGHALRMMRDPFAFLTAARPLGDIVTIRLGASDAYVLNSPALIRQVMVVEPKKYGKGVQFDKLRPVLGNGLVTAAGEEHRRHRRLVQPAFHHSRIAAYAETMRELSTATAASWQEGRPIAVDRELTELTMRIVGRTLFSTELGEEVVDEVVRSMPIVLGGITRRALSPTPLLEKLPTAANRRFDEAITRLKEVVDRIIAQYRASGVDHGDMVSMLLLARDEETGEGMPDAQIRDEVITMLMAGTETTANLLSWTLHVLGGRPDIEARVHAEVDGVMRGGELRFEDIRRLEYVRQVISETLRLYPPAWMITRRTGEPVTLGGVDVKAGATVLFSQYTLHRDPALYADPDTFDPDRWSAERVGEIARPSFVPFGAGSRQCIGEGFAWTEAAIVLAAVTSRWKLRPASDEPVRMLSSATLAPSHMNMVPLAR